MAGHSKWANIKHRKARQDAVRGKIFTKIIREIVSAAKQGDPDPDKNPRLRAVIEKALSVNMTRDTINRAVDRGTGGGDNENMEEVSYEGYGVGGVAVSKMMAKACSLSLNGKVSVKSKMPLMRLVLFLTTPRSLCHHLPRLRSTISMMLKRS